jgi:hypothetical protein
VCHYSSKKTVPNKTYIKGVGYPLEWMESDDLLEKVKGGITRGRVREICHRRRPRPRYDGGEEDPDQDSTAHTVHHENQGKYSIGSAI